MVAVGSELECTDSGRFTDFLDAGGCFSDVNDLFGDLGALASTNEIFFLFTSKSKKMNSTTSSTTLSLQIFHLIIEKFKQNRIEIEIDDMKAQLHHWWMQQVFHINRQLTCEFDDINYIVSSA